MPKHTAEEIKDVLLGKNCSTCIYCHRWDNGTLTCAVKNDIRVVSNHLCDDWERYVRHDNWTAKEILEREG